MGWRRGRSIKDSHASALYDARRHARRAFLAFSLDDPEVQTTDSEPTKGDVENFLEQPVNDDISSSKSTPGYVLNPKQDLYGLGFDPYKHAPEFREKKRLRSSSKRGPGYSKGSMKDSLFGLKSGKVAPGFGIGALEELDDEDVDVYAGHEYEDTYVQEVEEPPNLSLENKKKVNQKGQGNLPGFRVASNSDYQMERFEAPVIPKDFVPHHTFSGPLEIDRKHYDVPPPEVPPPEDSNLKLLIEGVANLVARCGKLFEDLSREKNQSNPLFNFLSGGTGHDYYARKLWEARQKRNDQSQQQLDGRVPPASGAQRLTAENRGQILGEMPLERSFQDPTPSVASTNVQLQFNLTDTFTKSASFSELPELEKPFKDDPAKQERFEMFLKEKYKGGLRSTSSSLASNMSEAARARERLDFEAAAEAIQKGKQSKGSKLSTPSFVDFSAAGVLQFTSGGVEPKKDLQTEDLMAKKMYPKREEFQWRPSPILCKRYDLIDPYMGKPPPAPRIRSKMDSLIFTSDSVKGARTEEPATAKKDISPAHQFENEDTTKNIAENETEVEVEVENVERPVDLYKAIFSDDSDDEGEESKVIIEENQEKKAEVANTALSRLIAGDFLESLGKELGLVVPPDMLYPTPKSRNPVPQKATSDANARNDILNIGSNGETSLNQHLIHAQDIIPDVGSSKSGPVYGHMLESGSSKGKGTSISDGKSSKITSETDDDRKVKTPSTHHDDYRSSSSSEGERSRKRARHEGGSSKTKPTSIADGKSSKFNGEKDDGRKIKTPFTHRNDYSSSSSSEEERSRKHTRHHRPRRHDSGSDDDRDLYSSRSKGRNKGSSRIKSSGSRKHSKRHKHRRRDSPSRLSHHRKDKDHVDGRREKKWRE